MATRVGINGFGRIGRNFFRAHLQRGGEFDVVAANDLGDAKTMAHLLRHDSVLGTLDKNVTAGDGKISVAGHEIQILAERDPASLSRTTSSPTPPAPRTASRRSRRCCTTDSRSSRAS